MDSPIMSTCRIILVLFFSAIILNACSSIGVVLRPISPADGYDITAQGAIGGIRESLAGPMYVGDGGNNFHLAVITPEVQGDVPDYLPLYVQGLLNNNIGRFSAINLIDRQNLDRIIHEQNLAASGRFSDRDFISIGNLTNTQYYLFGTIQRLSDDQYTLQFSVTESSTGVRKANFMKSGALSQIEGRGDLLNEATADLLEQMGIQLTASGLQTLMAGDTSAVLAEAGLARGITAQAGGAEVEAMFNFAQAITFAPSQPEAISRLSVLSTTISGGTISQRIMNDIQARDQWLEAFRETTRFFNNHPPFEIIFDPNLIQIGETDFRRRTVNLGMRIALGPANAGFDALNALIEGLEKTGRRDAWGFSGWPLLDISPRVAGTVVFGGRRAFSYKVDIALINENNKTLANSSVTLTSERINFTSSDRFITAPGIVDDIVNFSNLSADDLTPTLTIVIAAVNGVASRNIIASGYMKIETGDLEELALEREMAKARREREVLALREQERIRTQQREREEEALRERERLQQRQRTQASVARFWDNAERDFLGISGFYQWGNNNLDFWGLEVNYYWALFPLTSLGFDIKLGFNNDDNRYSNDLGFSFYGAPNFGLVVPLGNRLRVYSDIGVLLGMFPPGLRGTIIGWITPTVNAGLLLKTQSLKFLLKYNLALYEYQLSGRSTMAHALSIGMGF